MKYLKKIKTNQENFQVLRAIKMTKMINHTNKQKAIKFRNNKLKIQIIFKMKKNNNLNNRIL